MDEIVADADCSKSLIYWYWGSKADLFIDLIDLCMQQYVDLFEKAVASDAPYLERIFEVTLGSAAIYEENVELNKLVHLGAVSDRPGENFRELIGSYKNRIMGLIEQLLLQGVGEGILKDGVDAPAMALFIMSTVEGYIYLSILEERLPMSRLFGVLQTFFLPHIISEV